jgi:hypothetical protein
MFCSRLLQYQVVKSDGASCAVHARAYLKMCVYDSHLHDIIGSCGKKVKTKRAPPSPSTS